VSENRIDPVLSENRIDIVDLTPPVYQTCGKWWRHNPFEFSDTTGWTVSAEFMCYSKMDNNYSGFHSLHFSEFLAFSSSFE
jgi:hypothetical protein